ncbi:MAG: ATP-binding protein [Methanomassiliicoccales archaeon]
MLIEYSVTNFRSIRNKVTLSLQATADGSHPENLICEDETGNGRLLRVASIYGANASGKSNIFHSLNALISMVRTSHENQPGAEIKTEPYAFDEASLSQPTEFEIIFIAGGIRYVYGLALNRKEVVREHLYQYPKGKRAVLFARDSEAVKEYTFTQDRARQTQLASMTPRNVLYLSRSANLNYERTRAAYEWFRNGLRQIDPSVSTLGYTCDRAMDDPGMKEKLLRALRSADLGINDLKIERREFSMDDLPADMPEELKNGLRAMVNDPKGPLLSLKITSFHQSRSDPSVPMPLDFDRESDGTKRYLALLGPWLDTLENGRALFVDELDVKLHPFLVRLLIKAFSDAEMNRHGAQLIFTTHNTSLLDMEELFRRDQIWVVARDGEENTSLLSLSEYQVRKNSDIEKAYVLGRFGGVPFVGGSIL